MFWRYVVRLIFSLAIPNFLRILCLCLSIVKTDKERRPAISLLVSPLFIILQISISLVLSLTTRKVKVLFAGDVGPQRQKNLAELEPRWIKETDWLLWPHHGDRLDPQFLNLFEDNPICVVSVGENPWGMPSASLETQAGEICRSLHRTDKESELTFVVGKKVKLLKMRW